MLKCKSCGYAKNEPGQPSCNLCGKGLDQAEWVHTKGKGGPSTSAANAHEPSFLGVDRMIERGARTKVEEKTAGRVDPDRIVYAGDFAIVYVFTYQGGMIVLKPGEVFTFGRGDNADHKIDSKACSRRHARIHWRGTDPPAPEVVDLESKNGISVNGVPVKQKLLDDGDNLMIGPFSTTLRVLSANDDLQAQLNIDRLSSTTASTQRLTGEVKLISIPWLLGHLERQKESGTLTVHDKDQHGYVALISGVAIAAGCGDVTGEEAIKVIAKMRAGRFAFSPHADVPPQSIGKTLGEILGPPPGRRRPPPPRPGRGSGRPAPPPRR